MIVDIIIYYALFLMGSLGIVSNVFDHSNGSLLSVWPQQTACTI